MIKLIHAAAITLMVLFAANAYAGCGDKHAKTGGIKMDVAKHIFEKADTNNDGILTTAEHDAADLGKYGADFSIFDTNEDGKVTLKEYKEVYDRFHNTTES